MTRVTSDVDALNEMFTSGVLAIFEDVFILAFIVIMMMRMSWPLALLTICGDSADSVCDEDVSEVCAGQLSAAAGGDGEDQFVYAGVCVGDVGCAAVQPREAGV